MLGQRWRFLYPPGVKRVSGQNYGREKASAQAYSLTSVANFVLAPAWSEVKSLLTRGTACGHMVEDPGRRPRETMKE
jgi:hypothetical protein